MEEEKPLVVGRGMVRIEDFAQASGTDPTAIEALLRSGELEGVFFDDGSPLGLFDDVLPSRGRLTSLGLTVIEGYDPGALRSYVDDTPDPDESEDPGGSTWSMSW